MLTTLLDHPHRTGLTLGLFVLVVALSGCASIDMDALAEAIENGDSTVEVRNDRAEDGGHGPSATVGDNEIVMYSLTTCSNSSARRASFERQGVAFTEHFVDESQRRNREMWSKLSDAGYSSTRLRTPVVEVNGHILPNNPSMAEIRAHMHETDEGSAGPPVAFRTPNEQERTLHALINDYRRENGLRPVPLSKSLTHVAQAHTRDLASTPPRGECNLHSWSESGAWTACCYTPDHAASSCMWDKPAELTRYGARGYENAYAGTSNPDAALRSWTNSPGHNALLLNQGTWADNDWQAMGVGVHETYVVVWFGEERDPDGYWTE